MKVLGKDKVIGRDVTVEEMIKVVEQDRPYYRRSGGGLTLSGGESLCQPEFARDMLRAAKERGINTALESMACAPFETIETILPYLDLDVYKRQEQPVCIHCDKYVVQYPVS